MNIGENLKHIRETHETTGGELLKEQINRYARGAFEYEPLSAKIEPEMIIATAKKNTLQREKSSSIAGSSCSVGYEGSICITEENKFLKYDPRANMSEMIVKSYNSDPKVASEPPAAILPLCSGLAQMIGAFIKSF